MEKLQVAIEQARQRREGKTSVQPSTKSTPVQNRQRSKPRLLPDGLSDRWAGLKQFALSKTEAKNQRLVSHLPGREAAAYDVLRTKLLVEMRKNAWRRVAITSPTKGCGKTTTAANLALSISRQGDLRTALFEFDLRRPAFSRVFGAEPMNDISLLLQGNIGFEEQAMCTNENLAISMAKHSHDDPTRLIAGEQAADTIDQIEKDFAPDVLIFDLPPLLAADDTRAFLRNVDCALMMAQANTTTANEVDITEREIAEQTNVLGVVLNECRFDEGSSTQSTYG